MSEETGVVAEEATEAVTEPQASENTKGVREEKPQNSAIQRNSQEYNWAEANRTMKELQKSNREMADELARMRPKPAEEPELAEDDLPTYGHVKKALKKGSDAITEEVERRVSAKLSSMTLKMNFSDYDQVVTPENIEYLKQTEPELALSLAHNPDPYAQGVAAYKLLKKIGPSSEPQSVERKKAQENAQKPVSVNAVAKHSSAIGNVHIFENGLTPELKESLRKEMRECAKFA